MNLSLGDSDPTGDPLVRLVRTPPRSRVGASLLFVGTFVLFLLVTDRAMSIRHLAILAGVLLFHEAGHAIGMIALGYRDVRIFFIPFLGAATSGQRDGGAGWRHGVVLLLGPMPGILAGAAIALATRAPKGTDLHYAVQMLIFVNAFNLLPIVPLDGGRLLELVIFSRNRILELLSRIASAAAFAFFAIRSSSFALGVVAYLQVIGATSGLAVAGAADTIRREGHPLPERVEDASDDLIRRVHAILPARWGTSDTARAGFIRTTITRAIDAARAPGILGSIGLVVAWVLSVVVTLVAVLIEVKAS